jgi:hypothetical protein
MFLNDQFIPKLLQWERDIQLVHSNDGAEQVSDKSGLKKQLKCWTGIRVRYCILLYLSKFLMN